MLSVVEFVDDFSDLLFVALVVLETVVCYADDHFLVELESLD